MNNYNYQQNPKNNNNGLIIALAVMAAVVITVFVVGVLILAGMNSDNGGNGGGTTTVQTTQQPASVPPAAPAQPAAVTPQEPVSAETTMYVANVNYSIYFRSAPVEEQGNIITEILYGTPVTYMYQADTIFAKIRYNGQEGFVKREYLSSSQPPAKAAASSSDTSVKYNMYVANVKNSIYLRSDPSESGNNIICEIPLGTQVGFIEQTNGTFSKIKYGSRIGYSKSIYLSSSSGSSSSGSSSSYMTVTGVKNSVYLRKRASDTVEGNYYCEIPVGSTVEYISGSGKYYKVRWNGQTGYVTAQYLR